MADAGDRRGGALGGVGRVDREAVRAVAVSDLTNPEALDYVHERLAALGVNKALARAGAPAASSTSAASRTFAL